MTWIYEEKELSEEQIEDYIGFVYIIENLTNGRKYIGKKLFTKAKTKQVKKKKKKMRVQSDWKDYYGSNEELKADVESLGPDNFRREILHLCKSKGELSYMELKEQIEQDALLRDDFYNSWIMVKIRKSHLRTLMLS